MSTKTDNRTDRVTAWAEKLDSKLAPIYSWGSEGWDTPEFPLVVFRAGKDDDGIVTMVTVEGDVYTARHNTADSAATWIDERIAWYWDRGLGTPTGYEADGPGAEFFGPYI